MVSMYRFPGSRVLQWLLLLPLAIPAYVGAYALVDFLEYAGPVQTGLREVFGWTSARDYWFPEIRSRWAAIVVLSGALFPYVFLLARAAFREQSGCAYEVARALMDKVRASGVGADEVDAVVDEFNDLLRESGNLNFGRVEAPPAQ